MAEYQLVKPSGATCTLSRETNRREDLIKADGTHAQSSSPPWVSSTPAKQDALVARDGHVRWLLLGEGGSSLGGSGAGILHSEPGGPQHVAMLAPSTACRQLG
ncbi:hypothetical protein HaLaN_04605, partial [Haematococcus lacustris]